MWRASGMGGLLAQWEEEGHAFGLLGGEFGEECLHVVAHEVVGEFFGAGDVCAGEARGI